MCMKVYTVNVYPGLGGAECPANNGDVSTCDYISECNYDMTTTDDGTASDQIEIKLTFFFLQVCVLL